MNSKSLQVLLDRSPADETFPRLAAILYFVKRLEIPLVRLVPIGSKVTIPATYSPSLLFPCHLLVRRKVGDGCVPLFPRAGEFCFPMKPLIVEQHHLFDALHEAGKIFKSRPLLVNRWTGESTSMFLSIVFISSAPE
jgi:hypothetical protein